MPGWVWKLIGASSVLFLLDRVFLFMESRGWMYWRRTKVRPSGGVGSALQELQSFFQPGQQHVVEAKRDEHEDQDENGSGDGLHLPPGCRPKA